MNKVEHISLKSEMSVNGIVEEYKKAGVLGAGNLARACDIYEEMLLKKACIFLGLSGPVIPSGLRNVVTDMIRSGYVDVIVTSGANVVHDMIEAFEGRHYCGSFFADDIKLNRDKIGRIGNVYTRMKDFEVFEDRVQEILKEIDEKKRENLSVRELLSFVGSKIGDKNSFLKAAFEHNVPVFSPGIVDSMLGLQLFFFAERNRMVLNVVKDMKELSDIVFDAKKTGAVILGGGVPKHYILGANLLRDGIDYGIQMTLDREEAGSLSGARLEEGISWGKARAESRIVSVVGDVTILFPIMVASIKERFR